MGRGSRGASGEGEAGSPRTEPRRLRAGGLWVALDQALFGFSTLLLNLVLAAWLAPADYGAFTVALAVLFLIGNAHTALFTEPMLVFAVRKRSDRFGAYLRLLVAGHAGFAAVAAVACAALGAAFLARDDALLGHAFLALAAAQPFVLLVWLLRRATYARFAPRAAALGGAFQLLLLLGALAALRGVGVASPAAALVLLGTASAVVAAGLLHALGVPLRAARDGALRESVLSDHWRFGRWILAASPFQWLPGNYYYLALPHLAGLAAAGTLRAMMNLVQPMVQLHAALRMLLVPALVEASGTPRFAATVRRSAALLVAPALVYWAALVTIGPRLVGLLYGEEYADGAGLLAVLGAIPVLTGLSGVAGSILRSRERPDCEFRSYLLASIAALALGVPSMRAWGTYGAALAYAGSYVVLVAAKVSFVVRVERGCAHGRRRRAARGEPAPAPTQPGVALADPGSSQ